MENHVGAQTLGPGGGGYARGCRRSFAPDAWKNAAMATRTSTSAGKYFLKRGSNATCPGAN
jgi:hypothetical protein